MHHPFSFRYASIPIIGCALILAFSFTYSTTGLDFHTAKIASSVLAIVASLPFALHLGKRSSYAPLFAMNCFYFVFGYALGPFFANLDPRFVIGSSKTDFPLFVCFLGLGSQLIGYCLASCVPIKCPTALKIPELGVMQVAAVGWTMLVASQIPLIFPETLSIPSVGQGFRLFLYTGVAIVAVRSFSSQGRIVEKSLFAFLLSIVLARGLLSGSTANALQIGLILAIAASAVKKVFVGFLLLTVSCLVLFAVNPVKNEYRLMYWRTDDTTDIRTKANTLVELLIDFWSKPRSIEEQFSDRDNLLTIDRINQFPVLERVTSMTPDEVPYWKGESFKGIFISFIPRIVWPNKPERTFGNQFGHRYFFLNSNDSSTSLNLPWLVEFYANFGLPAVVVGFMLLGVFFQYVETWYLTMSADGSSNTLMVGLFAPLAFPESDFALMFGAIVLGILTLQISSFVIRFLYKATG